MNLVRSRLDANIALDFGGSVEPAVFAQRDFVGALLDAIGERSLIACGANRAAPDRPVRPSE